MWHPARVTKKQQQKRDQPEVGPENETGYHQMMGGNLHVVFKKMDSGLIHPVRGFDSPVILLRSVGKAG